MRTATSRSIRLRAISSESAVLVAATKRLEMADLDMDLERASMSAPTGSATSAWRRVATPASMRSTTRELSRSAELNTFQVSSSISASSVVRPRGRSVLAPGVRRGRPSRSWCRASCRPARRHRAWRAWPRSRLGQLGLHHLAHHDEAGRRREGQQPVFDRSGHFGQRNGRLERQVSRRGPPPPPARRSRRVASSSLVVPFLGGSWLGLLNTYRMAGLRRGTTASLQQTWGHRPRRYGSGTLRL